MGVRLPFWNSISRPIPEIQRSLKEKVMVFVGNTDCHSREGTTATENGNNQPSTAARTQVWWGELGLWSQGWALCVWYDRQGGLDKTRERRACKITPAETSVGNWTALSVHESSKVWSFMRPKENQNRCLPEHSPEAMGQESCSEKQHTIS